jgi:hypothetical protein
MIDSGAALSAAALRCLLALLALGACSSAPAAATDIEVAGAQIHLELAGSDFAGGAAPLTDWVRRSAGIVGAYYGHFPVKELRLKVRAESGAGVQGGRTFANPDAFIEVRVGREVNARQLLDDWVLVHEMTHLALPDTGDVHTWLAEGVATYVEGIARVQAGNRAETDVWAEELRQMPRGMPGPGDAGLDHTHTWGRTYWGGAMFCLLADVDIRERTHLKYGLQDALRAILRASGGLSAEWPIERVLRTGDAAVGTTSLEDLYARLKDAPQSPDLPGLWRRLGVESQGDAVQLTDAAPLAAVRHAIMRAPAP